jgi:hypothetical protein
MNIPHHNTREAWLRAAIEAVRPLFTKHGFIIPDVGCPADLPALGRAAATLVSAGGGRQLS